MVVTRDQRNGTLMPQDKRVSNNAHLNGSGSSAEPVGELTALARGASRTIDTGFELAGPEFCYVETERRPRPADAYITDWS
jgi:hypothetical protein